MNNIRLENQICFPLYVVAKEITRKYQKLLKNIDLTYTQYLAMMYLWEKEQITSKELGERLYLDSGTLTPLLKKLEEKGYITRQIDNLDKRNLLIKITSVGKELEIKALSISKNMTRCTNMTKEEIEVIKGALSKLLTNLKEE